MKKIINKFTIRIYDETTLRNLDELKKVGMFDNDNLLICRALDIGLETLLCRLGKAKRLADGTAAAATPNTAQQYAAIEKRLKDLQKTMDEAFITVYINQSMLETLYNVEIARLHNEEISSELMDCGYFDGLPDRLQRVQDEITGIIKGK